MSRSKLVLIEFTSDTDKRAKGSRLRVDAGSAVGFCDKLKVAKRVGLDQPAGPVPVIPAPTPVDADPAGDTTPPVSVDDQ